ncbi:hypothetical protein ACHAWF_003288, partial [Thalassiosira exigua]
GVGTSFRAPLGDAYYRRIEAVEFALKADDGKAPWVLSQTMGLRVANVPLVAECPPPRELLDDGTVDPRRVFCLTIAPAELRRIRSARLERRGVKATEEKYSLLEGAAKSNYAERNYVLRDLKNAFDLTEERGWTKVDVTGRAVEETASLISELMNERCDGAFIENDA